MTTLTTALLALSLAQAPQTLTLQQALDRADQANLDIKAALTKVGSAKASVWKAWSGHLLQIGASASYGYNNSQVALSLPPPIGMDLIIQPWQQLNAQVSVSQALVAPQLWYAIQSAYRAEDAVVYTVENARREVLFGVAQAYYAVASLKRLLEVSIQLQEIAERQAKDATVRYKAGTIAKVARLRADIDFARAEQDTLRARNSYESAKLALAVLLDRQPDFEVVEPAEPPLPADLGALEQVALDSRPDVKAARIMEEVVTAQRRASAMRYLPSLAAFGRATYVDPPGLGLPKEVTTVGFALTWTILDGGLREAELRDSSARLSEAEANRRALENRAVAEVRTALLDLASARANAKKAKEQRDLADENQRLVDVSFKAGAATAVEQADATSALRSAEIQLATETLQAELAAVRVLKSAGNFDPVKRGRP